MLHIFFQILGKIYEQKNYMKKFQPNYVTWQKAYFKSIICLKVFVCTLTVVYPALNYLIANKF